MNAAFDLAHKLVQAKDPQEALALQSEYMKTQLAALQDQVKELGAIVPEERDARLDLSAGAFLQSIKPTRHRNANSRFRYGYRTEEKRRRPGGFAAAPVEAAAAAITPSCRQRRVAAPVAEI